MHFLGEGEGISGFDGSFYEFLMFFFVVLFLLFSFFCLVLLFFKVFLVLFLFGLWFSDLFSRFLYIQFLGL